MSITTYQLSMDGDRQAVWRHRCGTRMIRAYMYMYMYMHIDISIDKDIDICTHIYEYIYIYTYHI